MSEDRRSFRLISQSTKKYIKAARETKDFSLGDFIHGYFYARWPYLYIGAGKADLPLVKRLLPVINFIIKINPFKKETSANHGLDIASNTIADTYHGKAIPLETARELIMVQEPINQPDLEHVVPYNQARAIILENPDHIVVLDCPCRNGKENPCTPVDVCLIVGEPFASFISEHHPEKTRWITQNEAVQILEEEDERGHVHHAFFKDAMLGRYYAICNCCSCCCGAMKAHQNNVPMLASSGYVAKIDKDLCIDCGTCHDYCQFSALEFDEEGSSHVLYDNCMGCGICISKCPQEAIQLFLDPVKGMPLEVSAL